MGQRYSFGIANNILAELAGVRHYDMHVEVDAVIRAADAVAPLAGRLGIEPPRPALYGMSYCHAATLGCPIVNGPGLLEPGCQPCLKSPADIDRLREPKDYLATPLVAQRLALVEELRRRRADASDNIGHDYEGPATTAALMLGPAFFMLPHDDPKRAHRLMEFVTRTAVNYTRVLRARQGHPFGGRPEGICDDFAGIFPPEQFAEFVAPYWEMLYQGLDATERHLHSELLREGHLKHLAGLKIASYDPSVDQFLPADVLKRSCPVPYGLRIWPSQVQSLPTEELVDMYRRYARDGTQFIMFHMHRLQDEPKIVEMLRVARELA